MQTKDFKGQDLRGRSFKNQDLTGADFSGCDLRSTFFQNTNLTNTNFSDCNLRLAHFSRVNLIGAKFCRAKMGGRPLSISIGLLTCMGRWFSTITAAATIVFLAAGGNIVFFLIFADKILEKFTINSTHENLFILVISCELLCAFMIIISLSFKRLDIFFWIGFALVMSAGSKELTAIAIVIIGVICFTIIGSAIMTGVEHSIISILIIAMTFVLN